MVCTYLDIPESVGDISVYPNSQEFDWDTVGDQR